MACLLPQLFKCPSDTSSLHLRAPPHLHPTTTHHNPRLPSSEAYSTSAAEAVRSLTYIGAIGPPAKSPFEVKLASEALITGEEAVIAAAAAEVVGLPKVAVEVAKDASLVAGTNPSSSSPRRPVVVLPGLGNNSSDYGKLAASLKEYGVPVLVAKVSRLDWLRNAAGLLDANYWRGTLRPKPVLDWYLERVHAAISEAKLLAEGGCLSLIGHSAGGWLARVYLEEFRQSNISLLLTLGTPHLPPPKDLSGVIDQTRGLLDYVDKYCARAVYKPELRYVCVAGRYIRGARFFGNPNVTSEPKVPIDKYQPMTGMFAINNINKSTSIATAIRAWFIGQGYKQVCGQADVWGDGVVPEMSAHLEGALNISLEGVYHSPVGSDDILRPWYGSPSVLEKWVHHLLS